MHRALWAWLVHNSVPRSDWDRQIWTVDVERCMCFPMKNSVEFMHSSDVRVQLSSTSVHIDFHTVHNKNRDFSRPDENRCHLVHCTTGNTVPYSIYSYTVSPPGACGHTPVCSLHTFFTVRSVLSVTSQPVRQWSQSLSLGGNALIEFPLAGYSKLSCSMLNPGLNNADRNRTRGTTSDSSSGCKS